MIESIIYPVLKIILPAWTINSALNLLKPLHKIPFIYKMDIPVDGYHTWRGRRVLGNSTTYLGFFVSLSLGILFQVLMNTPGIIISLGMYFGHMLGSFIKRRMGKEQGEFVLFIDHGDGIFLTSILLLLFTKTNLLACIISLGSTYLTYPILCHIAYYFKLREKSL